MICSKIGFYFVYYYFVTLAFSTSIATLLIFTGLRIHSILTDVIDNDPITGLSLKNSIDSFSSFNASV